MATNTHVYEAMFIFDSNRFARDRAALPAEVEGMIKSNGGEVLVSRMWEERRLAYPIAGHRKGTYWLIYFRSPTTAITPLNRACEIHDGVLRQLVLKIHPHLDGVAATVRALENALGEEGKGRRDDKSL